VTQSRAVTGHEKAQWGRQHSCFLPPRWHTEGWIGTHGTWQWGR